MLVQTLCVLLFAGTAIAGDRLLATGGVTQIEGAGGGGLTPWALIAGYGTRDAIGGSAYATRVKTSGFRLGSTGVAVGLFDRVELSAAYQAFDLGSTAPGKTIQQDVVGLKLKVAGDAIFAPDSFWPQIAVGLQYKRNHDFTIPSAIGAKRNTGTDFYVAATKLFFDAMLGRNLLANVTVRATQANQLGLLGFGGDRRDAYQAVFEGSFGVFVVDELLVGVEYRNKPNNLSVFREDDAKDVFVAFVPTKHLAFTLAYLQLGTIADKRNQHGLYLSAHLSF